MLNQHLLADGLAARNRGLCTRGLAYKTTLLQHRDPPLWRMALRLAWRLPWLALRRVVCG